MAKDLLTEATSKAAFEEFFHEGCDNQQNESGRMPRGPVGRIPDAPVLRPTANSAENSAGGEIFWDACS